MIAILQQPLSRLLSSGNDNIYTVSGDTYLGPNVFEYKFIADVYVNGILATTLKAIPDINFGFGVFNTRGVANVFTGEDFFITDPSPMQVFYNCPNSSARISLRFGEEYVSGTTFVQTRNLVSGNTAVFFNGSLNFTDSINIDLFAYIPNATKGSTTFVKYLNNRIRIAGRFQPSVISLNAFQNQRQFLYFSNDLIGKTSVGDNPKFASQMQIFTFSDTGFVHEIGSYQINNPFALSGCTDIQAIGIGYQQLAALTSGQVTVALGSFPIFTPAVLSYIIFLGPPGGPLWEQVQFTIQQDCGRFASTAYTLQWLNEFGGFNSWLFNKKDETTQTKLVKTYKKQPGILSSNGSFAYSSAARIQRPFYTELQDSIVLNSDFLIDTDVLYLKTLFSSPSVYITDQNGITSAVTVDDTSYRINKKVNQKIYNLQLTVKQSYNDFRQNG